MAVWLLGVSTAAAVPISNGSFESGLTDWTVFNIPINTTIHVETNWPGFDGAAWLFLGGFDTQGYVEQTLTGLTSNTMYAVNFLMASELDRSDTLIVSMTNGSSTPGQQFFAPPGLHWNNWVSREYDTMLLKHALFSTSRATRTPRSTAKATFRSRKNSVDIRQWPVAA